MRRLSSKTTGWVFVKVSVKSGACNQNKEMRERVNSMSRLFSLIQKHCFGGLGVDTLTFCESTPFSEGVGVLAFSKTELRFRILFVELLVCDMRNLYINWAKE
jgi:hypothetical protein